MSLTEFFPQLLVAVIRRAPHEFKIACLEVSIRKVHTFFLGYGLDEFLQNAHSFKKFHNMYIF